MNTMPQPRNWRSARAIEHEIVAASLENILEHLEDVEMALEADEQVAHEARVFAALLRSRRTEFLERAQALRAAEVEP